MYVVKEFNIVPISMKTYLTKSSNTFPKYVNHIVVSSAVIPLFDIDTNCPKLLEMKRESLEQKVVKLLFVSIHVSNAFLSTRTIKC